MSPNDTNLKGIYGYTAGAEAILGVRTPRSTSELRPRIRYQTFPAEQQFNRTQGWLDLNSEFNTDARKFIVLREYSRS